MLLPITCCTSGDSHVRSQKVGGIGTDEFGQMNKLLQRLDRFWNDTMLYKL